MLWIIAIIVAILLWFVLAKLMVSVCFGLFEALAFSTFKELTLTGKVLKIVWFPPLIVMGYLGIID